MGTRTSVVQERAQCLANLNMLSGILQAILQAGRDGIFNIVFKYGMFLLSGSASGSQTSESVTFQVRDYIVTTTSTNQYRRDIASISQIGMRYCIDIATILLG